MSREVFGDVIGDRIEQVIDEWPSVRIFSELAELFARDGQIEHSKQFEDLWTRDFGDRAQTMCGYRLETFGDSDDDEHFRAVCQCHHELVPAGEEKRGEDIVDLQRRALTLSSAVDEHEQTEAQLEETVEKEREQNRRKNEFVAMLAHELRNPLASMLNAVHLMQIRDDESNEREQALLERQFEHVVRLVDDLLDISRISRGDIEMDRAQIDVAQMVDQSIEASQPTIDEKSHQFHVSRLDQGTAVEGDLDRLVQVVSNLLTNAAKYTPEGGDIWLDVDRVIDTVEIRVRDNGKGIASETLPQIFDLFYRNGDLESGNGGLGVGVALANRIVEQHGGSLEAHSDGPGHGSEFIVQLPRLKAPGAVSNPARETDRSEDSQVRVLLVDDNRDLTEMVERLLEKFGPEVRVAHDGESALEALENFEADIALIDLNMPGMSGRIRQTPAAAKRVPVGDATCRTDRLTGNEVRNSERGTRRSTSMSSNRSDRINSRS